MKRVVHLWHYIRFALAAVLCTGGVVLADWEVGDPALYYQLPDSDGWSVYSEWGTGPAAVADDWIAATTAPITGIDFWGGWRFDMVGGLGDIHIQIFDNDTSGPFARPGTQLWESTFSNDDSNPDNDYTGMLYGDNLRSFNDPRYSDHWYENDHDYMFQYNIPVIADPFTQQAGVTYWLTMSVTAEGGEWGWDSAEGVSGNTALFWDENNTAEWAELMTPAGYRDPRIPLDMTFVLTPEPETLLLFGLGVSVISGLRRQRP